MKKRVLLSSIVTIALCLSLIAGSTFALFTASDDIDISVNTARVDITAGLTEPVLYSVLPDANGAEFDENGKPYTYVKQDGNTFINGGTAVLNDDGTITLERVTPVTRSHSILPVPTIATLLSSIVTDSSALAATTL